MTITELIRGPALDEVRPDDAVALRDLAREQRARLATIRAEGLWDWLGGPFAGQRSLWPLYCLFAFLGLVPIAVVIAGFTQGPALAVAAALCALSVLPHWLVHRPVARRTRALFRRGELRPAVVIAAEAEASDPDDERKRSAQVLVGPGIDTPERLRELIAAGDRLRDALSADASEHPELEPLAQRLRRAAASRRADGSRGPVAAALGSSLEVADLMVDASLLPEEHLSSRLLFVIVDPSRHGLGSTLLVPSATWGEGADELCAEFPWEARR